MLSPTQMLEAAQALRRLNTAHNDDGQGACTCCKEHWPCDVAVVVTTISELVKLNGLET